MASSATEQTPLLPQHVQPANPKPRRTVTFDSHVSTSDAPEISPKQTPLSTVQSAPAGQPITDAASVISTLNNKLRRRNSQGAPQAYPNTPVPKIGPQRTTKVAEKLKILPNPEQGAEDEESGRDVYAQFTRIKDPTARRDAARLGREDRSKLPRVTAYCTAGSYRMNELMRYLKARSRDRYASPKLFDECIYTPYNYGDPKARSAPPQEQSEPHQRRYSDSVVEIANEQQRSGLLEYNQHGSDLDSNNVNAFYSNYQPEELVDAGPEHVPQELDIEVHTPEIFLFNYGTVVIWGMTLREEHRFLKEIAKFEVEKLAKDDIQTEDFNFYYTREYQARIYNDFISLMDKRNYMTKLAISHALSQSVKTSLYEDLVDNTIETTKEVPAQIAITGKVKMTRREINMQIGELFILRINIHLQGSVLDAPELMWAEPQLEPTYSAVRMYLEMDQRVALLTERLNVIADLLAVLKDQLTHTHGEYLEWIVIVLIAAEIVVAAVNILVDLYAEVD
ncbi:Sad1-interacting factor 2 [Microthyrium microscopicum]|uniref:Sad1-interacting factor 2 n=1 Tax=Microthyrium microscopicum TaxID=703497 RepID=A0A6A6URY1_9PEZI|nr:Sad1-interacting factor 2 [Microthyrium microscopicum]